MVRVLEDSPCQFKCGAVLGSKQGRAAHERWCDNNPERSKRNSELSASEAEAVRARREADKFRKREERAAKNGGGEVELVPAAESPLVPMRRPGRPSKLSQLQLVQRVEQATVIVLAAKFPNGIDLPDFPRVVNLVKAVEHG